MSQDIKEKKESFFFVGDKVRLLSVPDWLLNGLSEECQVEIIACIWEILEVTEIDKFGYIWLGDEKFIEKRDDGIFYGRPSFCITPEHIEKI